MICRNCGAGLEADRIDTSLGMVTCSHCGGLHDIPRAGIGTDTTPESTSGTPIPRKQRSEVALPSRFKVRKGSGSMEVSWATGGLFPGLVLFLMASATVHMQNSDNEHHSNTTRVRKHYGLSANSRKDGRVTILKGLHDPNQALWLEQELERLLGIADKHVTGSYTG